MSNDIACQHSKSASVIGKSMASSIQERGQVHTMAPHLPVLRTEISYEPHVEDGDDAVLLGMPSDVFARTELEIRVKSFSICCL